MGVRVHVSNCKDGKYKQKNDCELWHRQKPPSTQVGRTVTHGKCTVWAYLSVLRYDAMT